MKIQCDVCNKEEASVFCTADEAALCDGCDHRVHHANKLASKHQRFSLLHPSSSKQVPLCDICQEKRAFLFCQQDRAILCRDCDVPIHRANEHTQKHNRFLLTGVKLSAVSAVYTSSSSSSIASLSNAAGDSVPEFNSQSLVSTSPPNFNLAKSSSITTTTAAAASVINNKSSTGDHNLLASQGGDGSTSSISEYLIETLPGWHVEDFLDSSSPPFGFCKSADGMLPFFDAGLDQSNMSSFSPESLGLWVPHSPSDSLYPPQYSSQIGLKETKEIMGMKANRRSWTDDALTVPQISPPSTGFKRSRPLW